MNLAIQNVLQYFEYSHLPAQLQEVSKDFHDLAHKVANRSDNAETTVALRKLLEAKDAAVRSILPQKSQLERVSEAAKRGAGEIK